MDALPARVDFDPDRPVIRGPWTDPEREPDLEAPKEDSPDVRRLLARRVFQTAWAEPSLTMEDFATQRVVVCWRILRFWASRMGHPAGLGPISQLFRAQHPRKPLEPSELPADVEWTLPRDMIQAIASWGEKPLPLLPTALDPEDAERYCHMLEVVADHLGIPYGSRDNPSLGRYGLRHLVDPELLTEALPDPYSLVQWESQVVDAVLERLPGMGSRRMVNWLRAKFALHDSEAKLFLDMARENAQALTSATEEQRRAMQTMRLEELFYRTQDSDPRVALAAVKALANIQGLTRAVGSAGEFDDVLDALREVVEESQDGAMRELGLDEEY